MRSMEGLVTIVQEGRFQLLDRDGVAHQFLLAHDAPLESEQLPSLLHRHVRVAYTDPSGVIGHLANRIDALDAA